MNHATKPQVLADKESMHKGKVRKVDTHSISNAPTFNFSQILSLSKVYVPLLEMLKIQEYINSVVSLLSSVSAKLGPHPKQSQTLEKENKQVNDVQSKIMKNP